MSKPRLCEILGVEVDQEFIVKGIWGTYRIDSNGDFIRDDVSEFGSGHTLCYAIKHPDEIIDTKTDEPVNDPINHPAHYCSGDYECIDIMLATQGKDDVEGYCVCNAIKYLWRHKDKGGLEDVKKAR